MTTKRAITGISTITYNVTGVALTDVITAAGHQYVDGQGVTFLTLTGGAGLSTGTVYYVRDISGDTFKVATSVGGAAVNFTTDITAGTIIGIQANVAISQNTTETNSAFVITPKGNGAFILGPRPDGLTAGGNARGINTVDFQTSRTNANQVAIGAGSVLFGRNNRADGNGEYAFCAGQGNQAGGESSIALGSGNIVSGVASILLGQSNAVGSGNPISACAIGSNNTPGQYSLICGRQNTGMNEGYNLVGGRHGLAYAGGMFVMGTSRFSRNGDNQRGQTSQTRAITGTASAELLALATFLVTGTVLQTNSALNFTTQIIAQISTVGSGGGGTLGDCYAITHQGCIKRIGNSTSLVGTPVIVSEFADTSMATCAVAITADDTNEALKIEFTPPTTAVATTVIRVHCAITFAEVGY